MSYLIDDLARVLASPTPRRGALRLIGGALAAGLFGALGLERAAAQVIVCTPTCPTNRKCCQGCGSGVPNHCVPQNQQCPANPCGANRRCCGTGAAATCAPQGNQCCGNKSCNENQRCCGAGATAFCAPQGNQCCGKTSCGENQRCCG